jgi:hypothetical protein
MDKLLSVNGGAVDVSTYQEVRSPPHGVVIDKLDEGDRWERWYALYVRARFERAAERCLKGKGYQAFSPFYQTIRKRSGRTKVLDLPLFPGYVFCSFNAGCGEHRRRGKHS